MGNSGNGSNQSETMNQINTVLLERENLLERVSRVEKENAFLKEELQRIRSECETIKLQLIAEQGRSRKQASDYVTKQQSCNDLLSVVAVLGSTENQQISKTSTSVPHVISADNKMVEIGIQVDINEDPDIYYFAGGRHVGSQTDETEEYGPLPPFPSVKPIPIVTASKPRPNYRSNIASRCRTAVNARNHVQQTSHGSLSTAKKSCSISNFSSKSIKEPSQSHIASAPASSKCISNSKDHQVDKISQFPSSLGLSKKCFESGQCLVQPRKVMSTTSSGQFAEKPSLTKGGIVRSKSLINQIHHDSDANAPVGNLMTKSKSLKKVPCELSSQFNLINEKVKPWLEQSASSLRDGTNGVRKRAKIVDEDGWETVCSRSSRSRWSQSSSSLHSSNISISHNSLDKGDCTAVLKNNATSAMKSEKATITVKGDSILEKPSSDTTTRSSLKTFVTHAITSKRSNDLCKKDTRILRENNVKRSPQRNNEKDKDCKKYSSISSQEARTDGKEKAIENEKKKDVSLAPPPPLPPQLRQTEESKPERKDDVQQNVSQWKEGDEESSVDDEEIKIKEEALDSAIREEELLEEELRQVEKDFEMIENEERDDNASENDTVTSPENTESDFDVDNQKENFMDPDNLKDHFFFISIEGDQKNEEVSQKESERIINLREKLMSPIKRPDSAEALRKHREKLEKAAKNRQKLLQAKYNRYVELSERFTTLNESTKRLFEERRILLAKADERRKRAADKRKQYLKNIVRKAHDEDSKTKEIAFINQLEAENKRHDYLASAQEIIERLQTIQEDRRIKFEDRAAKAAAVIERQSHIKLKWQEKLEKLQEKQKRTTERILREQEEKAKQRTEMAQEKARDREERLSALNAAKQAEKEELQKKIQQKQEESARRHEENIEQIRQKASDMSTPRSEENVAATARVCTLCRVTVQSEVHELSHLRGKAHLDAVKKMERSQQNSGVHSFGVKFMSDIQIEKLDSNIQVDKNRFKTLKKHSKKLYLKLVESGCKFEQKESTTLKEKLTGDPGLKAKMKKNIKEIERLLENFKKGKGSQGNTTSMDRLIAEVKKSCVRNSFIKENMVFMNGVKVAQKVLDCSSESLPLKQRIAACNLLVAIIYENIENALYVLRGTAICSIINFCAERWSKLIPENSRWLCCSPSIENEMLPQDAALEPVTELLFNLLNIVPHPTSGIEKVAFLNHHDIGDIVLRTQDIIGYLVAAGVIDRLSVYFCRVRGPVDNHPNVARLLKISADFLILLSYSLHFCVKRAENQKGSKQNVKENDPTQFLVSLEASELGGAVAMSYSLLIYQGAPSRLRLRPSVDWPQTYNCPPPLGKLSAEVIRSCLSLINAVAKLDLKSMQDVLGSETVSLQFRHIASQLLWQIVPHRSDEVMKQLLLQLIIAIGNFTVLNQHNQETIHSGQTPTILQQLCNLPREFYTTSKLYKTLFPTLIAASHGSEQNRNLLCHNNVDIELLDTFLRSEEAYLNVITKRIVEAVSRGQS